MKAITPADLCDIEEIKQLKARYFRYVDLKQLERLRLLFTEDVTFEGLSDGSFGLDRFIEAVRARISAKSIHHGHMPEIRIIRPDYARGIWAMFDWVELPTPQTDGPRAGQRGAVGYGHYQEEYRKVDGVWKIAFMRLTRLRVDPLFGQGVFSDLPPDRLPSQDDDWLETGRT